MTSPEAPTRDLNKVLQTVRALIAKAEGTDNSEEADAYRAKADQFMVQYAIDEAALDATRPAEKRTKPEILMFTMCPSSHPMERYLSDLVQYLGEHCRCKVVFYGLYSKYGNTSVRAFGFPSDLKYLELLYTTVQLQMSGEIEPKPNTAKSFDENVYVLHEAGVKWQRIAYLMNNAYCAGNMIAGRMLGTVRPEAAHWRESVRASKDYGMEDTLVPWPDGARLKTAYRRWCKEIGDTPRAIPQPIVYQRNFASGYVMRIATRLWDMRQKNAGVGTSLALREEEVTNLFNETFADQELKESKAPFKERYDWEAQSAGREAANRADLGGTKVANQSKPELA